MVLYFTPSGFWCFIVVPFYNNVTPSVLISQFNVRTAIFFEVRKTEIIITKVLKFR